MSSPILLFRAALALATGLLPSVGLAEPACGRLATPIATIQGQGSASPMVGQTVTVEGIVTLDSRIEGGFGGFYLQQADSEADQDPQTSEALFVYTRRKAGKPGTRLRVTGTVKEFHGLTELVSIQEVADCGPAPMPEPILVTLPWSQPPEQLENMRVRFAEPLTIVDNYNLARYGELTLAATDQVQPTELHPPGPAALALSYEQQRHRVHLDDNRSLRNPRPVPWPPEGLSYAATLRAGDRVGNLVGVLDFRFDAWRVQPESQPVFVKANPRPAAPTRPPEASVRIMALNLANYFNGDGRGQGFPTPRGADTEAAFRQQQSRLVEALLSPEPDILAVTELENDGYGPDSAIAGLARALGGQWQYVRPSGDDGDDAIRTALLFRADRVSTLGPAQRLARGPFQSRGRPPLTQAFRPSGSDTSFRVIVPHLKSKSCRGARGGNQDQADGQGCFVQRRAEEARALVDWAETLPVPQSSAGTVIAGDLNSYARERPLAILEDAGFTSAVHRQHGCTTGDCPQYSYRYRGAKGSLDYALISRSLTDRIVSAQTWLINADEPPALGYRGDLAGQTDAPWRSSDHNPVILDLQL